MKIEWKNLFRTIALLEALLLLVLSFNYWNKVDKQKETIKKQREEINRLKIVEQDYEADKDYIYECYKQIENNAERSGK